MLLRATPMLIATQVPGADVSQLVSLLRILPVAEVDVNGSRVGAILQG